MKRINLFACLIFLAAGKLAFTQPAIPGKQILADSLRNAGDLKGAIAEYQKSLFYDPKNKRNLYNYACALSVDNQVDSCF